MTDSSVPLVRLQAVRKSFGSGEGVRADVLRAVDLELAAGESVAIVGPSGSGKSTLLNIVGTLDRPTSGSVALAGESLLDMSERRLAGVRNSEIGFVFQLHHLLPQCTILENVLVPTLVRGGAEEAMPRARALLDRVGLTHRLGHRPGQLSGGERQRVAVVRAMINQPKLLLADEPTGSLDRAGADNLADLLGEMNRSEGVALLTVTHSTPLAACMGRILTLRDGVLVNGNPAA